MNFHLDPLIRHAADMAGALAVVLVDLLMIVGVILLNWLADSWI
jgi:hypothetical protein